MISTIPIDQAVDMAKIHSSRQNTISDKMECKDEKDDTDTEQSSLESQHSASSMESDSPDSDETTWR